MYACLKQKKKGLKCKLVRISCISKFFPSALEKSVAFALKFSIGIYPEFFTTVDQIKTLKTFQASTMQASLMDRNIDGQSMV